MFARRLVVATLLASSALSMPALAQDADRPAAAPQTAIEDIVVTAQKRQENLQSVPLSIVALPTQRLQDLNVTSFNEFAQLLPSVTFQTSQPGTTTVYVRGVASGGDGNHSGPLPSVGVYLDEQPITTIGGTLDVHIYDVARIESLAGPQGTLYGASSEAGTIRIITNKPDLSGTYGRVDGEVNTVKSGDVGGQVEGFLNLPVTGNVAARVVGWYQHRAGFIDNRPATRSFLPQPGGITVNNAPFVEQNYNDVEVAGGRAALKIDLDENWTIEPTVFGQDQHNHGNFGYDPRVGDLAVQHFYPEFQHDRFVQAALTIQGKVGNWDLTYAGAYLDRTIDSSSDYTDYAEAYDSLYSGVGGLAGYFYFQDNAGNTIDPRQLIVGHDHFTKHSEELRVASPATDRFRIVAGAFYQHQTHLIHQDYQVPNLGAQVSVNGFPGTLWLTQQNRIDRDYAVFGEASYDLTPRLTLTAGGRAFIYDNSLIGFFGFGRNPADGYSATPYNAAGSSKTGVIQCFTTTGQTLRDNPSGTLFGPAVAGGPCTNLGTVSDGGIVPKRAQGQGFTHRLNLTWKPTDDVLLYGTWSRGFRPGGINRRGTVAPYAPDYLTNYEFGFKTTFLDKRLRLNGAVYMQDWRHFQFAFLGQNSFTEVHNGPNARIKGVEIDAGLTPLTGLSINVSGAYTDARTRQNLCSIDDPTYTCTDTGDGNFIAAPTGTRLPITPRVKISGNARYTLPLGSGNAFLQGLVNHQSSASSDIRTAVIEAGTGAIVNPAALTGRLGAFTTADFHLGYEWSRYTFELFAENAFDERAQLSRFQECGSCYQRPYIVTNTPRTLGLRAGAKF